MEGRLRKDVLPRTAQFLWKGLHNAHRIGKYWTHIPECEDRAMCKDCEVMEDLEHILVQCKSPGQEIIWKAAESLLLEKEPHWPEVSLGTILGCGLAEFRDDGDKPKRGTQRLYRILMSASAYLIWRLRNDRAPATEEEIINKWKYAVNQRLQVDRTLENRPSRGKRPALAPQLVLDTYEQSLPTDWLREPRVLVGSRINQGGCIDILGINARVWCGGSRLVKTDKPFKGPFSALNGHLPGVLHDLMLYYEIILSKPGSRWKGTNRVLYLVRPTGLPLYRLN
ncbi:hypothetical protein B0H17DRAFT_1274165 [Mycena rosella]|uniref:Reverse transcriptase zinc-binding domain-containing protein n=1 Tax=Mycena rosella TaxID=1033263 RepID=A0AAD7GZB5_MYCRO|nr:hypothetical protein B0H17DRAFT_1274165 [Mycena rosella]